MSFTQIWKDERQQWSTRRILLWFWTFLGAWAITIEARAKVYTANGQVVTPHFLSDVWVQAWLVVECALITAVFGPVMVDYMKNAAPVITSIHRLVSVNRPEEGEEGE